MSIKIKMEVSSPLQVELLELKDSLTTVKINLTKSPTKHSQEKTIPVLEKLGAEECSPARKYADGLKLYKSVVFRLIHLATYIEQKHTPVVISTILKIQNQLVLDIAHIIKIDSKLPQWSKEMQKCLELITSMVLRRQGQSTVSDLDKSARICHLSMTLKSSADLQLEFVQKCIGKYPEEPFFYFVQGSVLGAMEKYDLSVDISTKALKKFPNNLDLLYNNAASLQHSMNSTFESRISAWSVYLKYADKSDAHVPEFYYEIGCACILNRIGRNGDCYGFTSQGGCKGLVRSLNKSKRAYYSGLEAEKHALPCNFVSEYTKRLKAGLLQMIKIVENTRNNNQNEDTEIQKIIMEHRRMVRMNSSTCSTQKTEECLSLQRDLYMKCRMLADMNPISQDQVNPMDKFQSIWIDDMKTCEVYENRIVQLRIIEPALIIDIGGITEAPGANGLFVSLVVEDGKGCVMKVQLINYDHAKMSPDGKSLEETLGVGCRLSVMNPFVQSFVIFAEEVKLMIIVDDPSSSVILHPEKRSNRLCQYCLVEYAPLHCARCNKAFYCDNFCQNKDYKDFGHEEICSTRGQSQLGAPYKWDGNK